MLEARLHFILTALQGSGRPPQHQRRRLMALDDHASSSTMGNRGVELVVCDQCSFAGTRLMSPHIGSLQLEAGTLPEDFDKRVQSELCT